MSPNTDIIVNGVAIACSLFLFQASIGMNNLETIQNTGSIELIYTERINLPPAEFSSDSVIPPVNPADHVDADESVKKNLGKIQLYCLRNIILPTGFLKLRTYPISADALFPINDYILCITDSWGRMCPILDFNVEDVLPKFIDKILILDDAEKQRICTGRLDSDVDDMVDLVGHHMQSNSFLMPTVFALIVNTVLSLSVEEFSVHQFFTWLYQNYDPNFRGLQTATLRPSI